jgi:anaerobic selenocysteine-containing dehydrogenase
MVTVNDNRVTSVRGDPEHPISHGYLCAKGRALGELHHDSLRVDGSYVRIKDVLEKVAHKDALNDAAAKLQQVIDTHGSESIGMFMGSGGFIDPAGSIVFRRFRQQLQTNQSYSTATVDAISKVLVGSLMAGTMALVPHLDEQSTLVLIIGSNPLVSHGQSTGFADPVNWIRRARTRGEVYVIDPRRTETAEQATEHIGLCPGTDYALLAHLVRDVIERRGLSAGSLAQPTDGFDELSLMVSSYNENVTSTITGIGVDQLRRLCRSIDRSQRLAAVTGTGTSMSVNGNLVEWLAWSLMILTDSFDREGGMWFNPGYFTRLDERSTLPATQSFPSPPSLLSVRNIAGEWPSSLIPEEIDAGRLRALIIFGSSITTALPDPETLRSAVAKLDVVIVLDILHNANDSVASHLFGCQGQLERPDVVALDLYSPARYSQYTEAVVEAAPDRHEAWRVLADLALRLGLDAVGRGVDPCSITADDLLDRATRGGGRLAALREHSGAASVESDAVYGWAVSRLPDGCWHLAPQVLVDQLRSELPVVESTAPVDAIDGLLLVPRRQLRRENARAFREGEFAELEIHPVDAASRGIAHGAKIMISSGVGSVRAIAKVTAKIARGAVSLPHGYVDTNVNQLISAHIVDPTSGMPALSGTRVLVAST